MPGRMAVQLTAAQRRNAEHLATDRHQSVPAGSTLE